MNTDGMESKGEVCKSPLAWHFTSLYPEEWEAGVASCCEHSLKFGFSAELICIIHSEPFENNQWRYH